MNFLVTGGAGYIGSHMVQYLQNQGSQVVVLDNFSTGNRWSIKNCEIIELDLLDQEKLHKELSKRKFDAVFHFASNSIVSESFIHPEMYLRDNLTSTQNLINVMMDNDNHKIIFSSSASIYGNTSHKISENTIKNPINNYGKSKLLCEELLSKYSLSFDLKYMSLRYFNAAGADSEGKIGEYRNFETHLIPLILRSFNDPNKVISIYGNDYNTHDGTCIREYVHVTDLVDAHYKAFLKLNETNESDVFNLSSECGLSVLEIINYCHSIIGKEVNYVQSERRKGDPDILVSDCLKAKKLLDWKPQNSNIENIVKSAWKWQKYFNKFLSLI